MEQDLRYIYTVYQEGSLSRAAEKLYMTQPALSIAVRRVEERLGAELFRRGRHPLELTQAGEACLRAIRRMMWLEEEMQQEIEDLRHLRTGSLRLGGTHYLCAYIWPPLVAGFSQLYPGIQIEVTEDNSSQLAEALEKNELDLLLSCDPELIHRYGRQPAFQDHILLAVPQDWTLPEEAKAAALSAKDILAGKHLAPACPSVPLGLFQDREFLLLRQGNNLRQRSQDMFQEAGFEPKIKMQLGQMATALHFADSGMAAALLSDRLVQTSPSHLRFFRLSSQLAQRDFYFLLPQRRYTAFAVSAFLDYCREQEKAPQAF